MTLIRKNVLTQAHIVRRWLNRSVRTKSIPWPISVHTLPNQTFHTWRNPSSVTKQLINDLVWPKRSPMTKPINRDHTIHRWPNRSRRTKPYTCDQTHSSMTKPFTCDQTIHPWPKLSSVIKASHPTKLVTHDQTIYLWPNCSPITKLFIGD